MLNIPEAKIEEKLKEHIERDICSQKERTRERKKMYRGRKEGEELGKRKEEERG